MGSPKDRLLGFPLRSSVAFVFFASSFGSAPLAAQEHWTSLTAPHFEMYTTADQNQAVQTLQFLEGLQSFFATSSPFRSNGAAKTARIIAFSSEREYAPYAVRDVGNGYYVRTFNNDYIVLGNLDPRNRELVAHEYTHFVVDQAGLKLPIWLNEGLAEFYSSVEVTEKQVTIGLPLPRSLKAVRRQQFIPWQALFTVDLSSPYYQDANKVILFYAQSWALVHMLALDENYSAHLGQFLSAVSSGVTSVEALQNTYHKDMRQIEADLSAYLNRKNLPTSVLATTRPISEIHPTIGQPSDFQIQFALADLLSGKPSTLAEAQEKLASLSARYPEQPEPEEALGELALQHNRKEEARAHFAAAIQRHSRNAEVFHQYASLIQEAGATNTEVAAVLRQSLAIKPDFEQARLELGLLEAADGNFASALSLLSGLKVVPHEYEYEVYYSLAQCNSYLDHSEAALTYAQKAKNAAGNDEQKNEADSLLASLANGGNTAGSPNGNDSAVHAADSVAALTHVQGHTKALECSDGHRRLRVTVGSREMTFDIDSPNLEVRNASEDYSQWRCGPLKSENLTIVYTPLTNTTAASGQISDGKVRELIFF